MSKSTAETLLAVQIEQAQLPEPTREYRFSPPRRWRMDFSWPEYRFALEVEGGLFVQGRHSRGSGMEADIIKYNEAALQGWLVLRASTAMVEDGRALALVHAGLFKQGRWPK